MPKRKEPGAQPTWGNRRGARTACAVALGVSTCRQIVHSAEPIPVPAPCSRCGGITFKTVRADLPVQRLRWLARARNVFSFNALFNYGPAK